MFPFRKGFPWLPGGPGRNSNWPPLSLKSLRSSYHPFGLLRTGWLEAGDSLNPRNAVTQAPRSAGTGIQGTAATAQLWIPGCVGDVQGVPGRSGEGGCCWRGWSACALLLYNGMWGVAMQSHVSEQGLRELPNGPAFRGVFHAGRTPETKVMQPTEGGPWHQSREEARSFAGNAICS